jgi:hypothetical protein
MGEDMGKPNKLEHQIRASTTRNTGFGGGRNTEVTE